MTERALRRVEKREPTPVLEPYGPALENLSVLRELEQELRGKVDDEASRGPGFQAWRDVATLYQRALADAGRNNTADRLDAIRSAVGADIRARLTSIEHAWLKEAEPHLKDKTALPELRNRLAEIVIEHFSTTKENQ